MGLSTVMASTIVFYTLLVALGVMTGIVVIALDHMNKGYQALQEVSRIDEIDFVRGRYGIYSTFFVYEGQIYLNVTNVGHNIIVDYNNTDVIVSYTTGGVGRVYKAPFLGRVDSYPSWYWYFPDPGWYINEIYDATGQPGVNYWEPHTTLEMRIILPDVPDNNTVVTVTIATPRGGKEFIRFTWVTG